MNNIRRLLRLIVLLVCGSMVSLLRAQVPSSTSQTLGLTKTQIEYIAIDQLKALLPQLTPIQLQMLAPSLLPEQQALVMAYNQSIAAPTNVVVPTLVVQAVAPAAVTPIAPVVQVAAPAVATPATPVVAVEPQVQPAVQQQVQQPAAPVQVQLSINVPAEFILEGGTAQDVTVGSRNGEMQAFVIGLDGQLYKFQPNSMASVPWAKLAAADQNNNPITGFKDVSMSSDGVLCAVSDIGKTYVYYWEQQKFMEVPAGVGNEDLLLDKISVGNVNNVWAVNQASRNIYQLGPNGWELRAENAGIFIAAGLDGCVIGINALGDVYRYNPATKGWAPYPGMKLSCVAVGSSNTIYGTYKNGNVHELWQLINNSWQRVAAADGTAAVGIEVIAVNAVGTVFAIDYAGNIYNKGDLGVAITPGAYATGSSAITSVGTLVADPVRIDSATNTPVAKVSVATQTRKNAKKTGKITAPVKKTKVLTKRTKTKAPAVKKKTVPAVQKKTAPVAKVSPTKQVAVKAVPVKKFPLKTSTAKPIAKK